VLEDGAEIPYDHLIVATGAIDNYFGNAAWVPFAPGLKTLADAFEIRRRILLAFEHAERETDPVRRAAWLTFVVIGGGATGVELAASSRRFRAIRYTASSATSIPAMRGSSSSRGPIACCRRIRATSRRRPGCNSSGSA
jgi:NADH dehydrogenase FAD-containing subunit